MIEVIQLLRNIGKFDSYTADAGLSLSPLSMIYAENGRGKTTIAATFRSLSTGDGLHIEERHRLGAVHPPHVVFRCAGNPPAEFVFQNGAWSQNLPNMAVFDDAFVDQNVYSGLIVGSGHRQNLHELILGAQGIALNTQLQHEIRQIEADNREIRQCETAFPVDARHGLSVDDFCALAQNPNLDAELIDAERRLAASQSQVVVAQAESFQPFSLPDIDLEPINTLLATQLPDLDEAAAARVQEHIAGIGENAEEWVGEGMRRQQPADQDERVNCVFCDQDLSGSTVIEHYRAYFGESYRQLKNNVAEMLDTFQADHSGDSVAALQRQIDVARERRQFWSQFCEVPEIEIDIEQLVADWRIARDSIAALLSQKQAAPLEQIVVTTEVEAAVQAYDARSARIALVNDSLQQANQAIEQVQQGAAGQDVEALTALCARLRATRARYSGEMPASCQAYSDAKLAKAATETRRDNAKTALEQYRDQVFPAYQGRINHYLERFNAGYRIDSVEVANTRGGPTCNYSVVINNVAVPVSGAEAAEGRPSFRNTLSSGDRTALALAFFLASIDLDPNRADKIVVIDDPVSSFDDHRSLTTVLEIRRLAAEVHQVIVLSHKKGFLCQIWEGADPTVRAALHVCRVGNDSAIQVWNVDDDCVTEHDRRHQQFESFLSVGGQNQREVATAIRPHIEAFLRVAYAGAFPPGSLLGHFLNVCRDRVGTANELLSGADITELEELKDYANRFHHDTNPAYQTVEVNDHELVDFVRRTLRFVRRS